MTPTEVRTDLPAEPASAGQARAFLDAALRGWRCEQLLDTARLLVSELVSNAILHAGTDIQVVARLTNARVRVEVHDGSARQLSRKYYSPLSGTGRGLLLVEQMADDWGVVTSRKGKSVWFELDRSHPVSDSERSRSSPQPVGVSEPAPDGSDSPGVIRRAGGGSGRASPRARLLPAGS